MCPSRREKLNISEAKRETERENTGLLSVQRLVLLELFPNLPRKSKRKLCVCVCVCVATWNYFF